MMSLPTNKSMSPSSGSELRLLQSAVAEGLHLVAAARTSAAAARRLVASGASLPGLLSCTMAVGISQNFFFKSWNFQVQLNLVFRPRME